MLRTWRRQAGGTAVAVKTGEDPCVGQRWILTSGQPQTFRLSRLPWSLHLVVKLTGRAFPAPFLFTTATVHLQGRSGGGLAVTGGDAMPACMAGNSQQAAGTSQHVARDTTYAWGRNAHTGQDQGPGPGDRIPVGDGGDACLGDGGLGGCGLGGGPGGGLGGGLRSEGVV